MLPQSFTKWHDFIIIVSWSRSDYFAGVFVTIVVLCLFPTVLYRVLDSLVHRRLVVVVTAFTGDLKCFRGKHGNVLLSTSN